MPKSRSEARKKRRLYWRQEDALYFVRQCVRRDALGQLGVLSKHNVFEQLSMDLREMGVVKSARQCRGKLKQLKKMYLQKGRDMLFGEEMDIMFRNYWPDAGPSSSSSSSSSSDPVDIKTEPLDSDCSYMSDSSSMWNETKSKPFEDDKSIEENCLDFHPKDVPQVSNCKTMNIKSENILDNSAVKQEDIDQGNALPTNDSQAHSSLFEQSVLERLGKIETFIDRSTKVWIENQNLIHTKMDKLIEQQKLIVKNYEIIQKTIKERKNQKTEAKTY